MARTLAEEVAEPALPNVIESQAGVFQYTIGLGVCIGIALAWAAWRGKQWWLLVWSFGLVVSGVVSLWFF